MSNRERWLAEAEAVRARLAQPGVAGREQFDARTGVEFMAAIIAGELPQPPMGATLDVVPISAEPGKVIFQGTPGPQHHNLSGTIHGGYIATLLDSAVGCSIRSMLPQGQGFTTLELKVNYIRAITDRTGPVRAEGKIISVGRQVAVAEAHITDADGKLYAHATTTCLVFPTPAAQ